MAYDASHHALDLIPSPGCPNLNNTNTIRHVVLISVDGLATRFMNQLLNQGELPNLARLHVEGLWTHNARTDAQHTYTMPNHFGMITGRPTSHSTGISEDMTHGYVINHDPGEDDTLHNISHNPSYKKSVFDLVHDAGLRTVMFSGKTKFEVIARSYNQIHGAPDTEGDDHGTNKIDVVLIEASTHLLIDAYVSLQKRPHFTFLHIRDTDTIGHRHGWGSPEWNDALRGVDLHLGRVLQHIENTSTLRNQTAIVLTTDHGGEGTNHGDPSNPNNFIIPFIVWAPGVLPANRDLYACVPGKRLDPSTTQPPMSATTPPIRNSDAGNLVLELLQLGSIPGALNAGMDLL